MTLQQLKLDIWRWDICQLTNERNCRDRTGRIDSLKWNLVNPNQVLLMKMEICTDNLDQSFSRRSGVSDKRTLLRNLWGRLVWDRTMICPWLKNQNYNAKCLTLKCLDILLCLCVPFCVTLCPSTYLQIHVCPHNFYAWEAGGQPRLTLAPLSPGSIADQTVTPDISIPGEERSAYSRPLAPI